MRLGEQGADRRHTAPAAGGATETPIGPGGGTWTRGLLTFQHGKDLDIREDVAGADDHQALAL